MVTAKNCSVVKLTLSNWIGLATLLVAAVGPLIGVHVKMAQRMTRVETSQEFMQRSINHLTHTLTRNTATATIKDKSK